MGRLWQGQPATLPPRSGGEGWARSSPKSVRLAAYVLLATLGLLSSPALPSPLERIEPRLARAIEENRVFMTCTSLDAVATEATRRHWTGMVARARAHLVARRTTPEELAAFDKRTAISALVRDDQPLAEAIALCRDHADWFKRYGHHDFVAKIDDSPLPQRR